MDAVTGTGPQGAVTISDVEHAAASAKKPAAKRTATDRATEMRKSIAAAMSRSKREIPHYYLADEILMEKALSWLVQHNAERPITERVLPAVLQLKPVAVAAQGFGEFNGFWRRGVRARAGSLRSSEMSDPSITVTNLGDQDQGVDTAFGVIYLPQVALVGFGKPAQRVCAVDGGIRITTTVQATLAADHRASDGHRGALFLAAINELLQQPELLEK